MDKESPRSGVDGREITGVEGVEGEVGARGETASTRASPKGNEASDGCGDKGSSD